MKKFLTLSLVFVFLTMPSTVFADIDCNTKAGYTEMKEGKCYNPSNKLSYDRVNDYFYYDGFECGYKCNYEGKNCKSGICNPSDCQKSYTEMKEGKCYNPSNKLSYDRVNGFYYDGFKCGYKCNYEGKKCKNGTCNPSDCQKGYTEIKKGRCYNPSSKLSYDRRNDFYYDDVRCGENCDNEGKNCSTGFCNITDCQKGYTEIKKGMCYNPSSKLSYDRKNGFYYDDVSCGGNCDNEGKNCSTGFCNIKDCQEGYNEIRYEDYQCYNPSNKLSYTRDGKFYYNKVRCGYKCDYNGKNCNQGVCDAASCAPGYTELKKFNFKNSKNPSGKTMPYVYYDLDNFGWFEINPFRYYKFIRLLESRYACYNPELNLSYAKMMNEEIDIIADLGESSKSSVEEYKKGKKGEATLFSNGETICGIDCDYEGKNCKIGLCNVENCPKNYKKLVGGVCTNEETGEGLMYVSKNKLVKFHKSKDTFTDYKHSISLLLSMGSSIISVPITLIITYLIASPFALIEDLK